MNKLELLEHVLSNLRPATTRGTFWGLLGTMLLTFGLLFWKNSHWAGQPNEFMFDTSPDGIKNYMTTAWHVAHDSSFTHYGGMNYPFGEHSLFTDNQPLFSSILQWWHQNVGEIGQKVVGILNFSQIISMCFGAGCMFLLFRKLHLPPWYAGWISVAMVLLSPQFLRFDGHFGLSHTFVIPALLYFLCRYEERMSKRYESFLIGLTVWWSAQLHFYYFGMAALFLSLYIGYQILREFSFKNLTTRLSHWVVMVLVPFALLNMWIHWTDYATDRPASPYGFTTYIGFWEGVFLPYTDWPMYHWMEEKIVRIRKIDGEAHAYIGFVATAFFLGMLGWGIIRRVRKLFFKENLSEKTPLGWVRLFPEDWKRMAHHRSNQHFLRGIFVASFVLLLFACGFIFSMKGMEWMVNYMGPLRQFRGLGRFTWVFYYVINVLAFYSIWHHSRFFPIRWRRWVFYVAAIVGFYLIWNYVHHGPRCLEQAFFMLLEGAAIYLILWWLSKKFQWFVGWQGTLKLRVFQTLMVVVPALVLSWDAFTLQRLRTARMMPNFANRAVFDKNVEKNWLPHLREGEYQAMIPLPYYHMGSENLWLDLDGEHFKFAQLTAFHAKLPDMGVNMSRTSIGQLCRSVQFVRQPGQFPEIFNDLPDNRPFLLFIYKEKWEQVQRDYPHLIHGSEDVFEAEKFLLRRISMASVRQNIREHIQSVERDFENLRTLTPSGKWLSTDANLRCVYQSYDSLTSTTQKFRGSGAFLGNMSDTVWLHRHSLPAGTYNISFWTKANLDMGMNHELKIFEHRAADGSELSFKHEGLRHYVKMIVDDWALYDLTFEVREPDSKIAIFLQKKWADQPFFLDELMIKPVPVTLFRKESGWISRNNYWFKL